MRPPQGRGKWLPETGSGARFLAEMGAAIPLLRSFGQGQLAQKCYVASHLAHSTRMQRATGDLVVRELPNPPAVRPQSPGQLLGGAVARARDLTYETGNLEGGVRDQHPLTAGRGR